MLLYDLNHPHGPRPEYTQLMMKVLLPLDGSPEAEAVIPCALNLAQRLHASIDLVQVTEGYSLRAPELPSELAREMQQRGQQRAQSYLHACAPRFAPRPVHCHAIEGLARTEISRVAAQVGSHLIVMATHGREGVSRWLLGSVAEAVTRQSSCPVLLMRAPAPSESLFRHILLPLDGSKGSLDFLPLLPVFLAPGGRVTLLRSVDLSLYPILDSHSDLIREYFQLLKSDLGRVQYRGLDFEVVVQEGDPVEAILGWSAQHRCDLIALSSHGRSGLQHLWLGSVTEKVARHANCPVLVFSSHSQHRATQLAAFFQEQART